MPSVKRISPEISFNSTAILNGVKHTAKLVGVSNDYFYLYNLPLVSGTVSTNSRMRTVSRFVLSVPI